VSAGVPVKSGRQKVLAGAGKTRRQVRESSAGKCRRSRCAGETVGGNGAVKGSEMCTPTPGRCVGPRCAGGEPRVGPDP